MPFVYEGVEFTDEEMSPVVVVSALVTLIETDDFDTYLKLVHVSRLVHGEAATYGFLAAATSQLIEKHPHMDCPQVRDTISMAQMRACR